MYAQLAHADDIEYAYDEAGRLVQASNRTSGEAVRYAYDAAGNITSQVTGPLTTLAIGHFSPRRGPVGTQVTINGTGFASEEANNTVRFGGVAAIVVSATQTKIVTTVPASASSGPISMEVAGATVTSTEAFVVTARADGPSISAVLPSVSAVGNTVTIVGANLEPVAARNRVRFGNALAEVLAATETQMTVVVPPEAGSGRIKVTTPHGVALSPTEFIVLPAGYGAAPLSSIDRMSADGTSVVSITAAGNYGARLFEGKAGDLLTVGLIGMTVDSAHVRVAAPDNSIILSDTLSPSAPGLQVKKLEVSGTYTLYVFPNAVGSVNLGVFKPTTAGLTLGTPTPVNITMPGRRALLTFTVPADTYADVAVSDVSLSAGTFSLIAPNGSALRSQTFDTTGLSLQPLLKQAGPYSLLFDPTGSIAGNLTATVSGSAAATLGRNTTRAFDINTTGPSTFTFRGEAGEHMSIATDLDAPSYFSMSIVVKAPDGTEWVGRNVGTSYTDLGRERGSGVLNFGPLPSGGTYTATVQHVSGGSSSVQMTLSVAKHLGLMTTGATAAVDVNVAGQTVIPAFKASAGEFLSLAISENESYMRGGTAVVLTPDGAPLLTQPFTIRTGGGLSTPGGGSGTGGPYRHGTAVVNIGPLPMDGTYRVLLQQGDIAREQDAYTGRWLLTLSRPVRKTLTVNGPVDHERMEINGQGIVYSFNGVAGAPLSLGVQTDGDHPSNPNTTDAMAFSVFDPYGHLLTTGEMTVAKPPNFGAGVLNIGPLPSSGRYKIFLQQLGYFVTVTGGVQVALSRPLPASMNGEYVNVSRMGQGVMGTFSASAGQYYSVRAETNTYVSGARIRVLGPELSEVGSLDLSYSSQFVGRGLLNLQRLPTTGDYIVLVEQTGTGQNVGLIAVELMPPATGSLSDGAPAPISLPSQGQSLLATFAAERGEYRSLLVTETNGPIASATVSILDPNGVLVKSDTFFASGPPYSGRLLLSAGPLPVTGNYSVLIRQTQREYESFNTQSGLTLTIASPVRSASPNIDVNLTGQGALHTFSGTAGQTVSVRVSETEGEITHTDIQLLAPNGTQLRSASMSPARCSGCIGYSGNVTLTSAQLPVTGTYGVLVQQTAIASDADGTGRLSFATNGSSPSAGSTTNIATTAPGQAATSDYVAAAGESFSVAVTSAAQAPASAKAYSIYVLGPNYQTNIACDTDNPGCELAVRSVPESGTYRIEVRPVSDATISGVLTVAPAQTGELALDTPLPVALDMIGEVAHLSFTTTVKQTLSLSLQGLSTVPANTTMYALLYDANGWGASSELSTTTGGTLNLVDLAPGAYSLWLRPQYPATSSLQVTLRSALGSVAPSDGTPVNVATVSAGQSAFYTFDAQAGESVGVALTNVAATPTHPTGYAAVLYVYAPGEQYAFDGIWCTSRCGLSLRNLSKSGTYRVQVQPYAADSTVTATLAVSKAVTGTLTPDQPLDVNLDAPGRPAQLSFIATAGQHFTLNVAGLNPVPADSTVVVTVYDSLGNQEGIATTSSGASIELPNLAPDTYFVWINQSLTTPLTGAMQVTLKSTPLLPADGASVSVNAAAIGQSSYFTFDAQAGESVGVALTNVVATPAHPTGYAAVLYVYAPGEQYAFDGIWCTSRCGLSLRNLSKSGTYRVQVQPYPADSTVTATLAVSKAVTGTLTPDQPFDVNLDAPGRPAQLSFIATAGQHFTLNVAGLNPVPADSTVVVTVYDSLGNQEGIATTSSGASIELPNLAPDTYFVWINQSLTTPLTGAMQVTLKSTPMLAADGSGVSVSAADIGQSSFFTFDAQAGESVGVALTNVVATPMHPTGYAAVLYVYAPGEPYVLDVTWCISRCGLSLRNLSKSGTYRVQVQPYAADSTVTATLTVSKAVTGTLTQGQPFALTLTAPGQPALLSFSQASAQPFSMSIGSINTTPAATSYSAILYDAEGQQVTWGSSSTEMTLTSANLPAGSYSVWIYSAEAATAAMTVSF